MSPPLLKLGIDTGGTYTDAVLVDSEHRIVASGKCLTTRHDLTVGIEGALDCLPSETLETVSLVALSTTLSTNSVVEGKGAPVAVLLPGYSEDQVVRSGLSELLDLETVTTLPGGHDALGREREPLDESAALAFVERHRNRVSAVAVSSLFGVRNPAHESRLRELIRERTALPVTCGHELASALDAPRRALTAALNARMIPVIQQLILAVRSILARRAIRAPLMMVKGDGSLINTRTALEQPVGTVLSGPAASVVGACALSGIRNAIIADMGGTTTDIAVVSDGVPELGSDGVRIGDWKPMVEAVRVISVGLGGDSEVRFSGGSGLAVGPRRVVPLSLLGKLYPETGAALRRQLENRPSRRDNRFALPLEANQKLLGRCDPQERETWERLARGPLELEALMGEDRGAARAVGRLQRKGLAIYSGFTPSDAAHVLGLCDHWDAGAAELAALLWARQMRHIYGWGRWSAGDARSPSRQVLEQVSRRLSRVLIEAGLHQHRRLDESEAARLTGLLAELVFESAESPDRLLDSGSLFHLNFAADYPLVGVGAPSSVFFPDAANHLGVELCLPDHGPVANAYGAVMGSVVQRAQALVTQPVHGRFVVHGDSEPVAFDSLEEAVRLAEQQVSESAHKRAEAAGARSVEVCLNRKDNRVDHDLDGRLFLETRVTATATGRPSAAFDPGDPVLLGENDG
ncbi:MAG: hydantoinase/oxoprolinase family protein [Xanthomonadales bacterium]|nr:hydantoinase/oxoprolinase family protein [Xanthomonadales bacterium]